MALSRKNFLKTGLTVAGALAIAPELFASAPVKFAHEPLPYAPEALEPHIDTLTMNIHHGKHYLAYVNNANEALVAEKVTASTPEELFASISKLTPKIRNNAGGAWNHAQFWKWMKPGGATMPASLEQALTAQFGSVDRFKEAFTQAAMSRFGSGWAWLIKQPGKKLAVTSTPNQDNPLMDVAEVKGIPLLGIDVWEHAYYLHYQNKRADYINAWWNVVNWENVAALLKR
jgi:Fe-Mn family superoxide dismutase